MCGAARRRTSRLRQIVESCRNEHLASLDADDGLTVLGIAWNEVVDPLQRHRREQIAAARRRCPRCEDRMEPRESVDRTRRKRRHGANFGIDTLSGESSVMSNPCSASL